MVKVNSRTRLRGSDVPAEKVTRREPSKLSSARSQSAKLGSLDTFSAIRGKNRTALSSADEVAPLTSASVVDSIDSGHLQLDVRLDPNLVEGLVGIDEHARAKLRLNVENGKIDHKRTVVDLKGVTALGIADVEALRVNPKGEIRADVNGILDVDVTEDLTGMKRIPLTTAGLAQELRRRSEGTKRTQPVGSKNSPIDSTLNSMEYRASGVMLKEGRRFQLGDSGAIHFASGTKLDVEGDTDHATLEGRADLEQLQINEGETKIKLGKSTADIKASSSWSNGAAGKTSLELTSLTTKADKIVVGDAVRLENAKLESGKLSLALSSRSGDSLGVDAFALSGDAAAKKVSVKEGDELAVDFSELDGEFSLEMQKNGQGSTVLTNLTLDNVSGKIDRLDAETKSERVSIEHATVEDAALSLTTNGSGTLDPKVKIGHFSGRVRGIADDASENIRGDVLGSGEFEMKDGEISVDASVEAADFSLTKKHHTVQAGQTFSGIARQHRLQSKQLLEANPQIDDPGLIKPGQELTIPGQGVENVTVTGKGRMRLERKDDSLEASVNIARAQASLGGMALSVRGATAKATAEIEAGNFPSSGNIEASLKSAKVNVDDVELQLRDARVSGEVKSIQRRPGKKSPIVRADVELQGTIDGDLPEDALGKLGAETTPNPKAQVTLKLEDAEINGSDFNAKTAEVRVDAQLDKIKGNVKIPESALALLKPGGSKKAQSTETEAKTKPFDSSALSLSKRIHDGVVSVEVPLNEAAIEERASVLGFKTVDLPKNPKLRFKLHVEGGKVDYEKSSAGMIGGDVGVLGGRYNTRLTKDGEVVLENPVKDVNVTSLLTGRSRLPKKMSKAIELISSGSTSSKTGAADAVAKVLDTANDYVDLAKIDLSAKGVRLARGKLPLGNDGYLGLSENHSVDIEGNGRRVKVSATIDGKEATIKTHQMQLELEKGSARFTGTIDSGIQADGTFVKEKAQADFTLDIDEARVRKLVHEEGDNRFEIRGGELSGGNVDINFKLANQGKKAAPPRIKIDRLAGDLVDSSMTIKNKDGSKASLKIDEARGDGSFSSFGDEARFRGKVDIVSGRLENVNIENDGLRISNLEGEAKGHDVSVDWSSNDGILLEAKDLRVSSSAEDIKVKLGSTVRADLARNASVALDVKRIDTRGKAMVLDATAQIRAGLDSGTLDLPGQPPVTFKDDSRLLINGEFSPSGDGGTKARFTGGVETSVKMTNADLNVSGVRVRGKEARGHLNLDIGSVELDTEGNYVLEQARLVSRLEVQQPKISIAKSTRAH